MKEEEGFREFERVLSVQRVLSGRTIIGQPSRAFLSRLLREHFYWVIQTVVNTDVKNRERI